MLKYIGDFDKLKDYGFDERPYAWVWGYGTDFAVFNIQKETRIVFYCHPDLPSINPLSPAYPKYGNSITPIEDVIYDLIKDGLIIKEG